MVQSLRGAVCASLAAILFPATPAAQALSDLRGLWSANPACTEAALRRVIGDRSLEWQEGGRRLVIAETRVQLRGDQIRFEIRSSTQTVARSVLVRWYATGAYQEDSCWSASSGEARSSRLLPIARPCPAAAEGEEAKPRAC